MRQVGLQVVGAGVPDDFPGGVTGTCPPAFPGPAVAPCGPTPSRAYAAGSPERASIAAALAEVRSADYDIASRVGSDEIRTGRTVPVVTPHEHSVQLWRTVGENVATYRNYPRVIGETGGKDFVLAHRSADLDALATALIRGAYEYQGQKCSAASRLYAPRSLRPALKGRLIDLTRSVMVGDPTVPENYLGAVINARQHAKHADALAQARAEGLVVAGGTTDASVGWFVDPTVLGVSDPCSRFMTQELFTPVLTAYVYDDADWAKTLRLVDESTSAAVGQQPSGGARASGTNDKAGTVWNLIRFASPPVGQAQSPAAARLPLPVPAKQLTRASDDGTRRLLAKRLEAPPPVRHIRDFDRTGGGACSR